MTDNIWDLVKDFDITVNGFRESSDLDGDFSGNWGISCKSKYSYRKFYHILIHFGDIDPTDVSNEMKRVTAGNYVIWGTTKPHEGVLPIPGTENQQVEYQKKRNEELEKSKDLLKERIDRLFEELHLDAYFTSRSVSLSKSHPYYPKQDMNLYEKRFVPGNIDVYVSEYSSVYKGLREKGFDFTKFDK